MNGERQSHHNPNSNLDGIIVRLAKFNQETLLNTRSTNILRRIKTPISQEDMKDDLNRALSTYKNVFLYKGSLQNINLFQLFEKATKNKSEIHSIEELDIRTQYRYNVDGSPSEQFREKTLSYLRENWQDKLLSLLFLDNNKKTTSYQGEEKKLNKIFSVLKIINQDKTGINFKERSGLLNDPDIKAAFFIIQSLDSKAKTGTNYIGTWTLNYHDRKVIWEKIDYIVSLVTNKELQDELKEIFKAKIPKNKEFVPPPPLEEKPVHRATLTENTQEQEQTQLELKFKPLRNFEDEYLYEKPIKSDFYLPPDVFDIDLTTGTFDIKKQKMLKIKSDEVYKTLLATFNQRQDLAAFFAINSLSSEGRKDYLTFPTESDAKKIIEVVKGFSQVFEEISTNQDIFANLSKIHKQSLIDGMAPDYDSLSFSYLNQQLARLLIQSINQKDKVTTFDLFNFLEIPYAKKAILALKKLFVLKLANGNSLDHRIYKQPVIKSLKLKELNINLISTKVERFISEEKIKLVKKEMKGRMITVIEPKKLEHYLNEKMFVFGYPINMSVGKIGQNNFLLFSWKGETVGTIFVST